jgi:hypothetical protein
MKGAARSFLTRRLRDYPSRMAVEAKIPAALIHPPPDVRLHKTLGDEEFKAKLEITRAF